MSDGTKLLRLSEVAEIFNIDIWTARKWASLRRFPIIKIGGTVRVKLCDIEKFIEERRIVPRPGTEPKGTREARTAKRRAAKAAMSTGSI
jgi:hypothetical protein